MVHVSEARAEPIVLDPRMRGIYDLIERVAVTPISVLLLGETGSGKEVLADFVHRSSPRASRAFVKINCAGLTEAVVESELFGHERGAFTGALSTHEGLFEVADGGTLFLDEIAELPLATQAKLLRVLETGEFMRVGATRARRSSFRVVAATHRNLKESVQKGAFRQDLFFRLAGLSVDIPPLRERRAELLALATMWLRRMAAQLGRPVLEMGESARQALLAHPWPGNVRELRNVMERCAAIVAGRRLEAEDLMLPRTGPVACASPLPAASGPSVMGGAASRTALRHELIAFERCRILSVLEHTRGNQTQAAKLLGVSRRTLTNKLSSHGIARPRK